MREGNSSESFMLSKFVWGVLLIVPLCLFGQTNASHSSSVVPILRSGDVPTYPPIAMAARITGKVSVRIYVAAGKVVRVEMLSADLRERGDKLTSKAAPLLITSMTANLKRWQFDKSVNGDFVVHYTYDISGTATDNPTNSRVEISPLLNVKITARPVKPTINY